MKHCLVTCYSSVIWIAKADLFGEVSPEFIPALKKDHYHSLVIKKKKTQNNLAEKSEQFNFQKLGSLTFFFFLSP